MLPDKPSNKPSKRRRRRNRSKKAKRLAEVEQKTNREVSSSRVKSVKKPCPEKAIARPSVTLVTDGWFDDKKADHFVPATIKVSLTETTSGRASTTYTGHGTVAVEGLNVYTDLGCTTRLVGKVSNGDLRAGKLLYVKGTAVAGKTARLTLDAAASPSAVTVLGPASAAVPFKKVNVITPKIELQSKVVLLNNTRPVDSKKTSVCQVQLQLEQTNEAHKCDGLKAKLAYGGKVECFKNRTCTQALASGSELSYETLTARNPMKLYLRGKTAGELKISLEPVEPDNLAKSYRLEAKKEETLAVVKIEVDVYAWADARNYTQDNDGNYTKNSIGKAGEGRELHYQDIDKSFKRARVTIKKPDGLLWKHGTDDATITLTPFVSGGARLYFYTSATGNTRVTKVKKADLGGDKTLWVEATGANRLDNAPRYRTTSPLSLTPEKETAACAIHFGAKVKSPDQLSFVDLHHGDGCKLKTHSFDRYLDRRTRNRCFSRIGSSRSYSSQRVLNTKDVASAVSGLHFAYGLLFGSFVNHNYDVSGTPIFNRFASSVRRRDNRDSKANRAARGVSFVQRQLRGHGITLHSVTKTMIKGYIRSVLDRGNFFNATNGVPGIHAEVLAVNAALLYLQSNGENPSYGNATLGAITVATYKLTTAGTRYYQGVPFPACPNCSGILNQRGLRILTE